LRNDVTATMRATCCLSCNASLDWVRRDQHLTPIRVQWRCAPGQQPVSYELTCRRCGKRLLVHITRDRVRFASDGEADSIRAAASDEAREVVRDFFEKELWED